MDHDVPTIGLDKPIADPLAAEQIARLRRELRRARGHAARARQHPAGHRARDRPAAWPDPAGHDGRLRRQPHLHPRRVRRAGLRHRHHRGRARAGHADAAAGQAAGAWRSPWTASCRPECTAKDLVLGIIRALGTGGGVGSVIEYRGAAIRALSMEGRMTVCNMSIEGGARAGMIAPDDTTFAYLEGRQHSPQGAGWERALDDWRSPGHATTAPSSTRRSWSTPRPCGPRSPGARTRPSRSSIDDVVPDPGSLRHTRGSGRRPSAR